MSFQAENAIRRVVVNFFFSGALLRVERDLQARVTGSSAEAFSVMCWNGLVPVVLWCWCFVCGSFRYPVGWPLHSQASELTLSPLIHTAAGALTWNPTVLEVEKKVGCGLFLEKTLRTKNFLKEPRIEFGTSMHLCGREWLERGGSMGHTRASMFFSRITYIFTSGNSLFQVHDLKMGQINSYYCMVSEVKKILQ